MGLWFTNADHPERIEYVLGYDKGEQAPDITDRLPWAPSSSGAQIDQLFERFTLVENDGRKCAVDGWNATAREARGKLLITVADDWYPCEHWDTELLKLIPDLDGDYAIDVSTGGNDSLMTFSIVTRGYFNRLTRDYGYEGGFFYKEYIGMYADNDFDQLAKRDGVVIKAKHLYFEHDHPAINPLTQMDDIYRRQHRPEAFEVGKQVFLRRMKDFGIPVRDRLIPATRPVLAFLVPGETFSQAWVGAWTTLVTSAMAKFEISIQFGFCSNVYLTRQAMWDTAKKSRTPDYILWIDDDQILTLEAFEHLVRDLEDNPDLDGVAGWAWCEPNIYGGIPMLSFGAVNGSGKAERMSYEKMAASKSNLIDIAYTGFPAVLLRGSLLDKMPERCFFPIFDDELFEPWGMSGEDTAFFFRGKQLGFKFAVDRRVKVPHLKLRCAEPVVGASLEEKPEQEQEKALWPQP